MSRSSPKCISRAAAVLLLLIPGVLFAQAGTAPGAAAATRAYAEARGSALTTVQYRVSRDGQSIVVESLGSGSTEQIKWTPGAGTTQWKVTEAASGNDFFAERTGNIIRVSGTQKGKTVDRQVKVDGAPWYQIFGPLMEELLPAGSAQREFWVVDPSDFAPHKMQVKRAGSERLTIRGTAVDTAKIHFSPAGALAAFWGADFWYRKTDGLWVTSRLPDHGAVTVSTVEELGP